MGPSAAPAQVEAGPRKEQRVGVKALEAPGGELSLPQASSHKQHRLRRAARQGRGPQQPRGLRKLLHPCASERSPQKWEPPLKHVFPRSVQAWGGVWPQVSAGLGRSLAPD